MNRSTLFKMAHQLTRSLMAQWPDEDYRVTFGAALRALQDTPLRMAA